MAAVPVVARSSISFTTHSPQIPPSEAPRSPSIRAAPAFSSPSPCTPCRRSSLSQPRALASPSNIAASSFRSQRRSNAEEPFQHFSFSTLLGASLPRCRHKPSRLARPPHAAAPANHRLTSLTSRRPCDAGDTDSATPRAGSRREVRAPCDRATLWLLRRRSGTACSAHSDQVSNTHSSNLHCEHFPEESSPLLSSSKEEHKPRISQLLLATLSPPSAPLKAAGAAVATAAVIWLAAALRSAGVLPRVSLRSLMLPPPAHAAVITAADPKPSRLASVAVDSKFSKPGLDAGAAAETRAEAGEVVLGKSAQQREQGIQEQQQQQPQLQLEQQQQKAPQRRQYYEVQGGRRGGVAPARYTAVVRFPKACGILVGTPVRMRGIAVGSVVAVRPSLTSVDVVVEILDEDIVIPRGTPIFVNQSGLIAETLIDMTPLLPIPEYDAGPRDAGCREEGVIVCHRERVEGEIGVSMDEMVRLYVKMGRDAEREKAKRSVGGGPVVVRSKV
ncbi:unnamed protein product [Closterium sp. NIES-54]